MAWNTGTSYSSSTALTAALINGIGTDLRTWGGNVDAGANGLANAAFLTLNPGTVPASPANGMLAIDASNIIQQYYSSAWHPAIKLESGNWQAITTLTNSWADIGSGYSSPAYCIDKMGFVVIRATIKSGVYTDGTTLFTLPSGFRPPGAAISVMCPCNAFGSACQINVESGGNVKIYGAGGNSYVHMYFRFSTI